MCCTSDRAIVDTSVSGHQNQQQNQTECRDHCPSNPRVGNADRTDSDATQPRAQCDTGVEPGNVQAGCHAVWCMSLGDADKASLQSWYSGEREVR